MAVRGCLKFLVQYCGLIFLVLALLLYHPVHEDAEQQVFLRAVFAGDNIASYVPVLMDLHGMDAVRVCIIAIKNELYGGDVAELLGHNRWVVFGYLLDSLSFLTHRSLEEGIQDRPDIFNGVNVRVFDPKETATQPRPAFVYVHGGGFVFGSTDFYRNVVDMLAKRLQAVVVSVDYRLTSEAPYPAALHDVLAVVRHVFENADALGVDANNIGIGGDSAGGNLAAAACLKLRDTSSPIRPKYQVLLYPAMQALTLDLPSMVSNEQYAFHFLSRRAVAQYYSMYIGAGIDAAPTLLAGNHTSPDMWRQFGPLVDPRLLPDVPADYKLSEFGAGRLEERQSDIPPHVAAVVTEPYAFPLMAPSLKGLPPAFVLTCALDPIRDDGVLFAQRLKKDGTAVEHHHDKHGFHGMMSLVKGHIVYHSAAEAMDAIVNFGQKIGKV